MYKSLIINPPFLEPHRPPISCAILAEICKQQGHEVDVVDLNIDIYHAVGAQRFHEIQIQHTTNSNADSIYMLRKLIKDELHKIGLNGYDWILISCFSFWNAEPTKEICQWLRDHSSAKNCGWRPWDRISKLWADSF